MCAVKVAPPLELVLVQKVKVQAAACTCVHWVDARLLLHVLCITDASHCAKAKASLLPAHVTAPAALTLLISAIRFSTDVCSSRAHNSPESRIWMLAIYCHIYFSATGLAALNREAQLMKQALGYGQQLLWWRGTKPMTHRRQAEEQPLCSRQTLLQCPIHIRRCDGG